MVVVGGLMAWDRQVHVIVLQDMLEQKVTNQKGPQVSRNTLVNKEMLLLSEWISSICTVVTSMS